MNSYPQYPLIGSSSLGGIQLPWDRLIFFPPQSIVDDESGATFWPTYPGMIALDGSAAIRFQGVDISLFAGIAGSSTPYLIDIADNAGKHCFGYLAEADGALALGAERVTDSGFAAVSKAAAKGVDGITSATPGVVTFDPGHGYVDGNVIYFSGLNEMTELNTQYWKLRANAGDTFQLTTIWDTTSLDTSGYAAEITGGNCAQKCDFTNWIEGTGWHPETDYAGALTGKAHCDGTQGATTHLYQTAVVTIDKHYCTLNTVSNRAAGGVYLNLGGSASAGIKTADATYTSYVTARGGTVLYISAQSTFIGTIDDVSVKEVTALGADGCHVVSIKNGSIQNWAYKDANFNYNDVSGYTFKIVSPTIYNALVEYKYRSTTPLRSAVNKFTAEHIDTHFIAEPYS